MGDQRLQLDGATSDEVQRGAVGCKEWGLPVSIQHPYGMEEKVGRTSRSIAERALDCELPG